LKGCPGEFLGTVPNSDSLSADPKRDAMDRQTLSIMKACEVVGVSRRTIYNWISAGKVEYVRTAGGAIRIFADSLWRDPASPARQVSAAAVRTTGSHA
jgi:excisionase family DNA binding protein